MSLREYLATDFTNWSLGPYHPALPGPMMLRLQLDGEIIVSGETEAGFLHRGLEKALERHSWQSSLTYADRLDPESAIFGELAVCLAAEEIAGIDVPRRAQNIRVILSELTRISSHLGFLARMAKAVGSTPMFHYVLRDRERVLDLFELLTGARFSINFLRLGGVSADVTEGFIERVIDVCELIRIRLKEYNDLFSFNHAFLKRSSWIGVLSSERARALGVTGPNARAAGLSLDVRKSAPYSGYELIDFEIPVGRGEGGTIGDAHDRFVLRLREITQSLEILKQSVDSIPAGQFQSVKISREFTIAPGEAYSRVESPRGTLGCHLVSDGGTRPARVQFKTPSTGHMLTIPELVIGTRVEDISVILLSLDISLAEFDR
ncbi:MAG: NADH-quinone oxidoreductase subunit D [Methylotenera sp.]|nr:NADH-quinone oxidoreductase subunit D [Oligoflexia bacterium]